MITLIITNIQVRACRRREKKSHLLTPINKAFQIPDEFDLLEYRASVTFIRKKIEEKGMLLLDAFRAFDHDRNGGKTHIFKKIEKNKNKK